MEHSQSLQVLQVGRELQVHPTRREKIHSRKDLAHSDRLQREMHIKTQQFAVLITSVWPH